MKGIGSSGHRTIRTQFDFRSPDGPISRWTDRLLSRQILDELVVEVHGFVEIFDTQALVFAVGPFVIDVSKHTGHAIGGDAGDAQILAVTGAGVHDRDNRNTA